MAALIVAPTLPVVDLVRAVAADPSDVLSVALPVTIIVATVAGVVALFFKSRWWG